MPTLSPAIRSQAPPFEVGENVLQRYRVESLLSEDALGYTYTVSEIATAGEASGALRVLRLLRARLGTGGVKLPDEALATWRSQLERAQDLRHPGIPPIEEMCFGDEQGRVFVVRTAIELEGQPLGALLAARPAGLSEAEAVRLLANIAEVVEAAHQQGILHLSLSPSRIFVVPSGESIAVRVTDFALLPPALAPQYGEPGYLTPEQVEGQPCDRRTDQFTLAVILYEMLSSQPAFIGAPDEDRQVTLSRVQHEDPLPLALSRPLEQALARALSRSRAVRFPNLHDLVRALGIDGVAWSLVLPPGSSKSPPTRPMRQALWQPVLLGATVASLAIFLVWGVAFRGRLGSSDPAKPDRVASAVDAAGLTASAVDAESPSQPANPASQPVAVTVNNGPVGGLPPSAAARPDAGASAALPLPKPRPAAPPDMGTGSSRPTPAVAVNRPAVAPTGPTAGPTNGGPRPASSPGSTGSGTGSATGTGTAVTPSSSVGSSAGLMLDITTTEGRALDPTVKEPILRCIKLIRPATPFRLILENINGTLFVADHSPMNELRQNSDFRNCLKIEFHGKIESKELSLKGFLRSKTSQ